MLRNIKLEGALVLLIIKPLAFWLRKLLIKEGLLAEDSFVLEVIFDSNNTDNGTKNTDAH